MINFRFHIVSLTAVMLALGIGLVLGTTFLDQATVDVLRERQQALEEDIDRANQRISDQDAVIEANERESEALTEQIGERLFSGQLTDDPVLVVATRGVDEDQVRRVSQAMTDADARLVGTWWLTDRLQLDDEDELADLGDALQLSTNDPDRLRAALAGQLGDVLTAASDTPSDSAEGEGPGLLGTGSDGGEPPVLSRLVEGGFVDYDLPEGSELDAVALPASGLRVVIVSGPEASVAPSDVVVPVLIDYSATGPVPAVAVEPTIVDPEDGASAPESLVVDIRGDGDLRDRVSTVDDIERPTGLAAAVLAVADADPAEPRIGHYGMGSGARLLPEPLGTGE